jgi:hypothetical protein
MTTAASPLPPGNGNEGVSSKAAVAMGADGGEAAPSPAPLVATTWNV